MPDIMPDIRALHVKYDREIQGNFASHSVHFLGSRAF